VWLLIASKNLLNLRNLRTKQQREIPLSGTTEGGKIDFVEREIYRTRRQTSHPASSPAPK
jgi:hypothetical protein